MKPRTGKELQAAKAESVKRYQKIADTLMEEAGVEKCSYHEGGLRGKAWLKEKHISVPKPTTRRRLYIIAHECSHIALNHVKSIPSHRKEYEAETYAHQLMRRHGVAVPKIQTQNAKLYVAYRVDQAVRIGKAKRLDRDAVAWCSKYHGRATRKALKSGCIELQDLSRTTRPRRNTKKKIDPPKHP